MSVSPNSEVVVGEGAGKAEAADIDPGDDADLVAGRHLGQRPRQPLRQHPAEGAAQPLARSLFDDTETLSQGEGCTRKRHQNRLLVLKMPCQGTSQGQPTEPFRL